MLHYSPPAQRPACCGRVMMVAPNHDLFVCLGCGHQVTGQQWFARGALVVDPHPEPPLLWPTYESPLRAERRIIAEGRL